MGHEPVACLLVPRLDARLDDPSDRDLTVVGTHFDPEHLQLFVHQIGSERALRVVVAICDGVPVALHSPLVISIGHRGI
ncbi:MAG: hypothetical protein U0R50_13500 [Gaiellales bacterium]